MNSINPADALATAAQVSVALAGFTGVVAVFGAGALHDLPPIDRYRLRLMVAFSALPLLTSLGGIALLTTDLPWPRAFDLCSAFVLVLVLPSAIFVRHEVIALHSARAELGSIGRIMLYVGAVAATAALLLQVYNLAVVHAFWPFYGGVVISVGAATVQFTRLVLTRAHPRG